MILKYLPKEVAAQQMAELGAEGLKYSFNGFEYQEPHYNCQLFLGHYHTYCDHNDEVRKTYHDFLDQEEIMHTHWLNLGKIQRLMLVNHMQELFNWGDESETFDDTQDLCRVTKLFNGKSLYPLAPSSGVGFDGAIMQGGFLGADMMDCAQDVRYDFNKLSLLCKKRMEQFVATCDELKQVLVAKRDLCRP